MEYAFELDYKGIEVNAKIGKENNIVQVPGDVTIKVTGKCGFWETFLYFRALRDMLNRIK